VAAVVAYGVFTAIAQILEGYQMADFNSVVNAPLGVSYAPPAVNFNSLGSLLDSFTRSRTQPGSNDTPQSKQGSDDQQQAATTTNGTVGTNNSAPNWPNTSSSTASNGLAIFGPVFGQDDGMRLSTGLVSDPGRPAAGVASPATVRAHQDLFFGADGQPVSVSQLYGSLTSFGLHSPNAASGAAIPEGARATDWQTGQRIIFKGGQWQPTL
jgi:hypothetical protein